jgi:hypothetical protein
MRRNARALILSEEFRRLKAEKHWTHVGKFICKWFVSDFVGMFVTKTGLHPMKLISTMIRPDNWLR